MIGERSTTDPDAANPPSRPSRRRVLVGLGASIAAGFAGCSGIVDSGPSYRDRTDVDVDGDGRTAGEMATAEAVAEREVTESVQSLDALSFEDHEFVLKDDFRGSTVEGTLANTGDDPIQLVEVRARVYDAADDHLGRYLATTGDLAAGSSWKFEVVLLEAPNDIDSYDLTALGILA